MTFDEIRNELPVEKERYSKLRGSLWPTNIKKRDWRVWKNDSSR